MTRLINQNIYCADWACGGQWNHMVQFLAVLIQTTEMSGIEFAIFFNGCLETSRSIDWVQNQLKVRNKVNDVSVFNNKILIFSKNKLFKYISFPYIF